MAIDPDLPISPNFTYGMLVRTDNRKFMEVNKIEGEQYLANLTRVANEILEPINNILGPMFVTSCFRCDNLNKAIGGAPRSQHRFGEAADMVYLNRSGDVFLKQAFNTIVSSGINFGQLIYEFGWIHCSITDDTLYPGRKGEKLLASRANGKTIYTVVSQPL